MTNLSKRATKALTILKDGGYFSYGLETDPYTARVQFHARLFEKGARDPARGFGCVTMNELKDAGMLALDYSTSTYSSYRLAA